MATAQSTPTGPRSSQGSQSLTGHVLHGDEGASVDFARFEERSDGRMLQASARDRLLLQALLQVERGRARQQLDGRRSPERDIQHPIDHPHAACADALLQPIVADDLAIRSHLPAASAPRRSR